MPTPTAIVASASIARSARNYGGQALPKQKQFWLEKFSLKKGEGEIIGITKDQTFTPEKFKMRWGYFLTSILVAVIVGVVSGIIVDGEDWRISLLAGYVGTVFQS